VSEFKPYTNDSSYLKNYFINKTFFIDILACPKGRAVHCIFSFPKEGKEKDAIPIPHAIMFSKQPLGSFKNHIPKNYPHFRTKH
jgi:hypothetical protein